MARTCCSTVEINTCSVTSIETRYLSFFLVVAGHEWSNLFKTVKEKILICNYLYFLYV